MLFIHTHFKLQFQHSFQLSLTKKGTQKLVALNQLILKAVSVGACYKHRPLLPQFEQSCLHLFDHAAPFTYKSYATSQNTDRTRRQHVPPGLQSRPQLDRNGCTDWPIMHICLCLYLSMCCGMQVQNTNHYASALPLPLSKILYFKATNHSVIAADTKFLHDVTFISEQNQVLLTLILPHRMNMTKLLVAKQNTFKELRKDHMMVSHPFYISEFSEEIIQDSFLLTLGDRNH